ncbi:MAG: uncharacterized SAM-binding protein YcdF (DUF218 family) [Saprospiraceae bacterium]
MKRFIFHFFTYLAGILSGIILVCLIGIWVAVKAPSWLVVEREDHRADIGVVLGGGGGSRLRTGLFLYDEGKVDRLVLVDKSKLDWIHIQKRLCLDCETEGKDVTIIEGSINTFTDASLVAQYSDSQDIDSILVITDPYHSRRALLIFESQFKGSGIDVSVVSSGDYVGKLPPGEKWWLDNATSKVVWGEISKIVAFYVRGFEVIAE